MQSLEVWWKVRLSIFVVLKKKVQSLCFLLAGMKFQNFWTRLKGIISLAVLINSLFFLCTVLCQLSISVKFFTDH
uniref:Uncharacterized protein n=1 Tax=Arundo donax TaxID=35708 RepID=A0A0A9AG07_ARUDO